ncbi:MAG: serine hydrolase domain-containing protein [Bacteroidota bacterium]
MKTKLVLLLSISFLLLSQNAMAQVSTRLSTAQYQQLLETHFDKEGPGAAVLVAKKGRVVYVGAIGKANLELDVPMQPDHVFRIGSITKQFTAVAILMLMEQGKLDLQDEITKFIPDYPTQGNKITVEHLLTHTSGIRSMTSMPNFFENARKDMSTSEMLDFFKDEPMDFKPGEQYRYNNSG